MKKIILGLILGIMLSGCSEAKENAEIQVVPQPIDKTIQNNVVSKEAGQVSTMDDTLYIGEYLDYDNHEPNLEIAKGEEGKYIVQIGIFRLATFDDGVGELTEEGMCFTATDMAGNPIRGIITIDGQTAKVTFTDSTWELIENGTGYEYTKSSNEPKLWTE